MNFGEALTQVRLGDTVARKGWNGKKMFVYLNKGMLPNDFDSTQTHICGIPAYLFQTHATKCVTRLPNLNMIDANGNTVTGWLASQSDLLADDWEVAIAQDAVMAGKQ